MKKANTEKIGAFSSEDILLKWLKTTILVSFALTFECFRHPVGGKVVQESQGIINQYRGVRGKETVPDI